jgi:hypothetical protein
MTPGPGNPRWGEYVQYGQQTYDNIVTYTGSTPPSPPGGGGGGSDWMKPFEEFGGWLVQVGAGINQFIQTVGSTYSEMVRTTGQYPWGAIILIAFVIVLAVLFKVIL